MIHPPGLIQAVRGLKGTFLAEGGGRLATPDDTVAAIDSVCRYIEATLPLGLSAAIGYQIVQNGKTIQVNDATWEQLAQAVVELLDFLEHADNLTEHLTRAVNAARDGKELPILIEAG
ncbi:hypothetical protein HOU03_gp288 [Caulobacter phage CcrSC]|uniref:Uncharacterized protein n=1 Tax=Caulobacter phage CcrSC TaxID=2283272 RepID=A0A385EE97_9CAUD|nr:hypothetical protein HOU03_gp288 [Caulobacter phage CcrSC]AXQ69980.1 hypothetical protein CcrSC_gp398 [Caulobacter phage CcrSC]